MIGTTRQRGFSLTEVLLATGVLAVGFAMIAMVFPVGMTLTGEAVERSIGPVAAKEAEAKVRLYGVDLRDQAGRGGRIGLLDTQKRLFERDVISEQTYALLHDPVPNGGLNLTDAQIDIRLNEESFYPSLPAAFYEQNPQENRMYCWRTLCQKTAPHPNAQPVLLWTFVCRKAGQGGGYYGYRYDSLNDTYTAQRGLDWPMPIPVVVGHVGDGTNRPEGRILTINPAAHPQRFTGAGSFTFEELAKFFTDGCQIVDDKPAVTVTLIDEDANIHIESGDIYRVVERQDIDDDGIFETLILDRTFLKDPPAGETTETIWVVPPAISSGRNPCIGIYPATVQMN